MTNVETLKMNDADKTKTKACPPCSSNEEVTIEFDGKIDYFLANNMAPLHLPDWREVAGGFLKISEKVGWLMVFGECLWKFKFLAGNKCRRKEPAIAKMKQ